MFNVKMVKGGLTVLNHGHIRIQTRGLVVKNKSEGDWNQEDLRGLVEITAAGAANRDHHFKQQ